MKYILILSILAALVGGCAVAPTGYDDREGRYNHGDGNYPGHNYNDGNYHHYSDRGEHGNRRDPYLDPVA